MATLLHSETMALARAAMPNRARRWIILLGIWLLAGTLSALHWELFYFGTNPYGWWELFRVKVALWYVWGVLTPLILALGWRFRFERGTVLRSLLLLVPVSLVITTAYLVLYTMMVQGNMPPGPDANASFRRMFLWVVGVHSTWYYLAFWATIGLENAVIYYQRARERQRLMAELKIQLVQVQLAALKQQLQPHFLFNTLHSILILVRQKRNAEAIAMLSGLSDLLRHALDHLRQHEVPLRDELALAKQYVAIESIRFSDRLSVEWSIGDDTQAAFVPSFVLQPLIENAIRHGIERRPEPGRIAIYSRRDNGELCLRVEDDGAGLNPESGMRVADGHGLGDLRARLDALYPGQHHFAIQQNDGSGTVVELRIPYHDAPVSG